MGSGKRASMREGPLAALFRKTETEGLEDGAAPERAADAPAERPAPVPTPVAERPAPTPQERLRHAFSAGSEPDAVPPAPRADDVSTPTTAAAEHEDDAVETNEPTPPEYDAPARREVPPPAAGDYVWASVREEPVGPPKIRVVGVGGGGVNAVNRMIEAQVSGVEFIALNTDAQSLQQSAAPVTLQIGADITRGLGSGSDPERGRAAAMEDYDKIKTLLKGSDMIFITAGEGGGTGTGAAPIVARISQELGALTVGIVTKPFGFEGSRRLKAAEQGIEALSTDVDTLITVPNNKLLSVLDKQTSMVEAFRAADDVLRQGVQGISDLITLPGLINLDFADVRTIMSEAGNALLGIGMGTGDKRALEAAQQATSSPLLDTTLDGARAILLSITAGRDLSLWEVNEAARAVQEAAHPEANIIFGAMIDEKLEDEVWITVVATGYEDEKGRASLREPVGEPRVTRTRGRDREREPVRASRGERSSSSVDVDVPEFIPRF